MDHPYRALNAIREVAGHPVPRGVTMEPCAICHQIIENPDDAVVFQEKKDGPAYIAHQLCNVEHMQRIVTAFGRFGGGRMAKALRGR